MRFHLVSALVTAFLFASLSVAQSVDESSHAQDTANAIAVGQPNVGQPAAVKPLKVLEVTLPESGVMQGTVVDQQGTPQAGAIVQLHRTRGAAGVTRTDKVGRFAFNDVTTGPKLIRTRHATQAIRIWSAKTAPPAAKSTVLVVSNDRMTVRGQCAGAGCSGCDACSGGGGFQGHFGGVFQRMLQNPWLVGLGTAAAIAIPLATDDDDNRDDDFANQLTTSADDASTDGSGEPADTEGDNNATDDTNTNTTDTDTTDGTVIDDGSGEPLDQDDAS